MISASVVKELTPWVLWYHFTLEVLSFLGDALVYGAKIKSQSLDLMVL